MEKKTLCLYFQVHQPLRLRKYQFFDIGKRHDYYDEYANHANMQHVAQQCYLPANRILLDLIREYGNNFKISFSISGIALELFEKYTPEVIESYKALAETGCVEFVAQTYSHSLACFADEKEFKFQVTRHAAFIQKLFNQTPVTFRNSEMIYSDHIGNVVAQMGYTTMLTEGAKHILGWKTPNFVYTNAINPKLKLLLRNFTLSDDIALRFSDQSWEQWPLTAEKYTQWILDSAKDSDVVNLFLNYEVFGDYHAPESGIFLFLKNLPQCVLSTSVFEFLTPREATEKHLPVAPLNVPFPISWSDEERDVTAWLGNELQEEAFEELYKIRQEVVKLDDPVLNNDFSCIQDSDNLYYMSTKLFSNTGANRHYSPYESPYEAFVNYMNIVSDITDRIHRQAEQAGEAIKKVKAVPVQDEK